MNTNADFYQVLQVNFNAEKADIISAYRRLCKLYHPDVSLLPQAQELMAQINVAYDTLSNDVKRQAYNKTLHINIHDATAKVAAEAQAVITDYFSLLLRGGYGQAYQLLCASDRLHVNMQSFVEWRQAVQELYGIREFNIRRGQYIAGFKIAQDRSVSAIKFFIDVQEKDQVSGRLENYCFTKYVVFEQGRPGVYLGYRDLGEISKMFGSLARQREQSLMQQHWQAHTRHYDRVTGLLTREGLLCFGKRELYQAQRYKQPLTLAAVSLQPAYRPREPLSEACLDAAALALKKSLRQTDTPAHLGDGLFVILFAGLKKRHAALIVERTLQKTERAARAASSYGVSSAFAFEPYESGPLEPYLDRLCAKIRR